MRTLPDRAVFTVAEALAAGWTPAALRHAVAHGRLIRVRRGMYRWAGTKPVAGDAIAAALLYRDAVVSHRSAVLLHGLPLLGAPPAIPELTVAPRTNANFCRAHVHRASLRPHDITLIGDVPVTSVARTVTDLARHRPLGAAVSAIDAALYRGLVGTEELADVLRFCWNWPRIRRAHLAVRMADGAAESPLESISRLVLGWLGVPRPTLQPTIFDRYGRVLGRPDFYWDETGVVGEADGRVKYDSRSVLTAEKERQELFEDAGLVVVRWGWEHATRRRYALEARLSNGFARGRLRDGSGFPRLWSL